MAPADTLVLIVEDEPAIAELIQFSLREDSWRFGLASSVTEAWDFIREQPPQLVLLDWMLRNESGLRLLSRIRAERSLDDVPVILLTGRTLDEDWAIAMENGADDYVTKPFSPRELAIRAKAALRRVGEVHAVRTLQVGPLELDTRSCTVRVGRDTVEVRQAEYRLLKFLLCHPEEVFSRAQLLDRVWHANGTLDERTVDVHILRLRKALREAKSLLKTVRGLGYKLSAAGSP
jgi:two-component system, OmpR family, phosphate regulon response regulator PhoB